MDRQYSHLSQPSICKHSIQASSEIAGAEMTGPILEGLSKPAHVLQRGDSVRDVVHMAAICAVDAQRHDWQKL